MELPRRPALLHHLQERNSGRQIEVVGGSNGLRALHLKCSTPGCCSTPADWILPVKSDTVPEIDMLFRDDGV
jgi:hypothetical protein